MLMTFYDYPAEQTGRHENMAGPITILRLRRG